MQWVPGGSHNLLNLLLPLFLPLVGVRPLLSTYNPPPRQPVRPLPGEHLSFSREKHNAAIDFEQDLEARKGEGKYQGVGSSQPPLVDPLWFSSVISKILGPASTS